MTGSNEMRFNTATMIEIGQYWLDNKLLNKQEQGPMVTHVEEDNVAIFKVLLEERKTA